MVKINIYCVGSIKENYLDLAINEYLKRLSKYVSLKIIECDEFKIQNGTNESIIIKESNNLIKKINKNDYLIALDSKGKEYTSIEFSSHLKNLIDIGKGQIGFIIGGSLGFSEEVKSLARESISFSKLTFPHQLFRVFLLEQLYRAFRIINNEPYHH